VLIETWGILFWIKSILKKTMVVLGGSKPIKDLRFMLFHVYLSGSDTGGGYKMIPQTWEARIYSNGRRTLKKKRKFTKEQNVT